MNIPLLFAYHNYTYKGGIHQALSHILLYQKIFPPPNSDLPTYDIVGAFPQKITIRGGLYDLIILWGQTSLQYVDSTRISSTVTFPIEFTDVGSYGVTITPVWQEHNIYPSVQKATTNMIIQSLSGSGGFPDGYSRAVDYVVMGRVVH